MLAQPLRPQEAGNGLSNQPSAEPSLKIGINGPQPSNAEPAHADVLGQFFELSVEFANPEYETDVIQIYVQSWNCAIQVGRYHPTGESD